jgi:hypothetical protein
VTKQSYDRFGIEESYNSGFLSGKRWERKKIIDMLHDKHDILASENTDNDSLILLRKLIDRLEEDSR